MLIARELGCDRIILPKTASALSAAGMQYASIVSEEAVNHVTSSQDFDFAGVGDVIAQLKHRLAAFARGPGQDGMSGHSIEVLAEARYAGQIWELDTPLPAGEIGDEAAPNALVEEFHRVHERIFAVGDEGSAVEFINWKARLAIPLAPPPAPAVDVAPAQDTGSPTGFRACYFGAATPVRTAIYKSADIAPGLQVRGPAIIEEPTTTLVVFPGMSATMSAAGNYQLQI